VLGLCACGATSEGDERRSLERGPVAEVTAPTDACIRVTGEREGEVEVCFFALPGETVRIEGDFDAEALTWSYEQAECDALERCP
jgi:hypothetical protein